MELCSRKRVWAEQGSREGGVSGQVWGKAWGWLDWSEGFSGGFILGDDAAKKCKRPFVTGSHGKCLSWRVSRSEWLLR